MSAAFATRLKMASTAFWFHLLKRLPRALCNCSKTKSCATRWAKEPATSCAKNFCCLAMSNSISISSPNSENDTLNDFEVRSAIEAHQEAKVRSSERRRGIPLRFLNRIATGWEAWPRRLRRLRCSFDSAEFTLSERRESNQLRSE